MSLYTRSTKTISSSLPAKDKAHALRAAADATNPARWLAAFAASPTTSRNNQLLAANLRTKVEADPAIRDAVYVALVLATANAHAEADRVFLEPVTRGRRAAKALAKAQLKGNAGRRMEADKPVIARYRKWLVLYLKSHPKTTDKTAPLAYKLHARGTATDNDVRRFKRLWDKGLLPTISEVTGHA